MNIPNTSQNEMLPGVVSIEELAEMTDLSTRRVQQLTDAGIMCRKNKGAYILKESLTGYIRYLKKLGESSGTSDDGEYHRERTRLTKARADILQIEAALASGRSHDAEAIRAVWAGMIINAKTKLLAIPVKAAPRCEGETVQSIRETLEEIIHEALNELADYDPRRLIDEHLAKHLRDIERLQDEAEAEND